MSLILDPREICEVHGLFSREIGREKVIADRLYGAGGKAQYICSGVKAGTRAGQRMGH